MAVMKAITVDPDALGKLAITEVEESEPGTSEAVVRVRATSLNLGDVYRIPYSEPGWRPGWDLAGVVERAAQDGSGPPEGARVFGLRGNRFGAWAERVPVPTDWLAELPGEVGFAAAATLPTCGLTALYAIERAGSLLGRTVLVTGASGGLGHFLSQLAVRAGARVIAGVRRPERAAAVQEFGVSEVVVGEDLARADAFGPYDVIFDQLGGEPLAQILPFLVPGGLAVSLGISAGTETTLNLARLFAGVGGVELVQLVLFTELDRHPGTPGLNALGRMTAEGSLRPLIDVEAPWTDAGELAQRFLDREIVGKAVLHFPG